MRPEMALFWLGVVILAAVGGFHGVFKFMTEDDINSWVSRIACIEVALSIIIIGMAISAFANA